MKFKALAFAAGMACAALPAFAADQLPTLSAGKAVIADAATAAHVGAKGAATGASSDASAAEPQTYMLMLAGLGVAGLLLSRRRPY